MTFKSETWMNISGNSWVVQYDDKTQIVSHVDSEEVFNNPPSPMTYDYVCLVLSANGYTKIVENNG